MLLHQVHSSAPGHSASAGTGQADRVGQVRPGCSYAKCPPRHPQKRHRTLVPPVRQLLLHPPELLHLPHRGLHTLAYAAALPWKPHHHLSDAHPSSSLPWPTCGLTVGSAQQPARRQSPCSPTLERRALSSSGLQELDPLGVLNVAPQLPPRDPAHLLCAQRSPRESEFRPPWTAQEGCGWSCRSSAWRPPGSAPGGWGSEARDGPSAPGSGRR